MTIRNLGKKRLNNFVISSGSSTITALSALAASSKQSFHIRAISRSPSSPTALSLANSGVEVLKGDFRDRGSLEAALVGVNKLFLMTSPMGSTGAQGEEEEGKLIVDLAKKAGVKFIVSSLSFLVAQYTMLTTR